VTHLGAFRSSGALRAVALVSLVYDALLGVGMTAGRGLLTGWFGLPEPVPAIHADLNGLFALAIAAGYLLPYRDPERYRGYLWVMGPVLKGGGAVLFIADHVLRGSPASFLLFAAADGALALVTLWVLLASREGGTGSRPGFPPG
jgi:hypothetical protein